MRVERDQCQSQRETARVEKSTVQKQDGKCLVTSLSVLFCVFKKAKMEAALSEVRSQVSCPLPFLSSLWFHCFSGWPFQLLVI